MNVDPKEVEKFSELASRWWDKTREFRPLHEINPVRMGYIKSAVELKGKRVLDIGCGGGILTESLSAAGAKVTGIDMSKKALAVAELHLHESKLEVEYQMISAEDYAKDHQAEFDVITCMEMLEHVPDPSSILKACYSMLKPGGTLFASTINRNPKSYMLAIVGAEYIMNLLPKGTHQYNRFIKPSELISTCRELTLEPEDLTGYTLNPLTWQAKLCDSTSVNYIARFKKP